MKHIIGAALFALWATGAIAHSPLERSTPTDNAILVTVPTELVLAFKGTMRLTRVTLQVGTQPDIDLDLSGFDGFISDYVIALPSQGPGAYMIKWRGLGGDGHALTGTLQFTVE